MLNNRAYIGEAVHKGESYPGEHDAIIDRETWDRVHAILQESPRKRAARTRAETPALLKGLLFGPDGAAFSPTHTRKGDRLYRYYVSQTVLKHGAGSCPVGRVPAGEIEAAVIDQLRAVFRQPEIVAGTWKAARAHADDITEADARAALQQLDPLWDELFPAEQARIVALLVERVDIGTDGLNVRLRVDGLGGLAREMLAGGIGGSRMTRGAPIPDTVTLHVPFRIVKRGGRKEMQLPEGATQPRRTDNTLVKALARAFRWKRMLESGEFATIAELAEREGIAPSYMTRVLRLTLLAPDIVEAILDGKQGPEVTLARVLEPFPVHARSSGRQVRAGLFRATVFHAHAVLGARRRRFHRDRKILRPGRAARCARGPECLAGCPCGAPREVRPTGNGSQPAAGRGPGGGREGGLSAARAIHADGADRRR
jgi:hypothetical protein